MHKSIASGFANILTVFHFIAALLLALAVAAAFAGAGGPVHSTQVIFAALGAILGYVLLFGFLSTIIRINQNLERIADANDKMASHQKELASVIEGAVVAQANMSEKSTDLAQASSDLGVIRRPLDGVTRQ